MLRGHGVPWDLPSLTYLSKSKSQGLYLTSPDGILIFMPAPTLPGSLVSPMGWKNMELLLLKSRDGESRTIALLWSSSSMYGVGRMPPSKLWKALSASDAVVHKAKRKWKGHMGFQNKNIISMIMIAKIVVWVLSIHPHKRDFYPVSPVFPCTPLPPPVMKQTKA